MPEDYDEQETPEFISIPTESPRYRSLFYEEEKEIRERVLHNAKMELSPEYAMLIEDILRMRRIRYEDSPTTKSPIQEYLETRRRPDPRRTARRKPTRPVPPPEFSTRK